MSELTVLDDERTECAVLIDTDTWTALPIVAMGENRATLLQTFCDSVPFDVTLLRDEALMEGWRQFLAASGTVPDVATDAPTDSAVESSTRDGNDAERELAEAEATNHTDTPAEQPADTDQDSTPPTRQVDVDCWNCNGTGKIEFGDGSEPVRCNVCAGTGQVKQTVPA